MSGKRQATTDLNHDNWDRDEEPEERGTFQTANENELKNRVIKKAARRKLTASTEGADDGGSATKSLFSGFSGFGKPSTATSQTEAKASPFSFLSKIPSVATTASTFSFESSTNTTKESAGETTDSSKVTFGSASSSAPKTSAPTTFLFGSTSTKESKEDTDSAEGKSSEYYAKLKGLNQSVSAWIKTHVDKNPLCILTPIFKDYEKYLTELEEEKSKSEKKTVSTTPDKKLASSTPSAGIGTFKFSETTSSTAKDSTPASSTFSFSSNTAKSTPESALKTNGFSFGLKKSDESKESLNKPPASTAAASGFSFGLKTNSETSTISSASSLATAPSTGITFGKPASTSDSSASKPFSFTPGSTPFSFGNIKPPEAPAPTENDDENEEPPKNDFKQVVESDAVYSIKCKVFVKKDGNFADKGVGTLYLKPIESSGKTQLIVRADTNLGNILVNLILSSAIPSQRMGKNNVMMVCVPSPDVEKPTSMLLRVKTGEEADDLLKNIEKYKK